jgi:hypothetical protein
MLFPYLPLALILVATTAGTETAVQPVGSRARASGLTGTRFTPMRLEARGSESAVATNSDAVPARASNLRGGAL